MQQDQSVPDDSGLDHDKKKENTRQMQNMCVVVALHHIITRISPEKDAMQIA